MITHPGGRYVSFAGLPASTLELGTMSFSDAAAVSRLDIPLFSVLSTSLSSTIAVICSGRSKNFCRGCLFTEDTRPLLDNRSSRPNGSGVATAAVSESREGVSSRAASFFCLFAFRGLKTRVDLLARAAGSDANFVRAVTGRADDLCGETLLRVTAAFDLVCVIRPR